MPTPLRRFLSVLPLAALSAACHGPLRGATSFVGTYSASASNGNAPALLPACAAYPQLTVDAHGVDPKTIGERYEEDGNGTHYPIIMQSDIQQYLDKALHVSVDRSGPDRAGKHVPVTVTVSSVKLTEKTYHNAEFKGLAVAEVRVEGASPQQACWMGRMTGEGFNYGTAGAQENYEETLARTVNNLATTMLRNPGFQDAVCGRCSGPEAVLPPLN